MQLVFLSIVYGKAGGSLPEFHEAEIEDHDGRRQQYSRWAEHYARDHDTKLGSHFVLRYHCCKRESHKELLYNTIWWTKQTC